MIIWTRGGEKNEKWKKRKKEKDNKDKGKILARLNKRRIERAWRRKRENWGVGTKREGKNIGGKRKKKENKTKGG